MAQPGERPFHDPALGDHLKLTFFSRRFPRDMESQFQFFADKSFRGTPIAGIARKGLNGGITLHGGFQNRTGGQGIGNIRGMNVNGKKVPQNIQREFWIRMGSWPRERSWLRFPVSPLLLQEPSS